MSLIVHFLLGFSISFIGTIPPSMLNMTTAKISIVSSKSDGLKFAVGVSLIVFVQAYIALYTAEYLHGNTTIERYITLFGIIIFALLAVYFFKQARVENKKGSDIKIKNSFRLGVTLSILNMFAIPFYCAVGSSLNMSGWINFEQLSILFFVFGAALGTYALHYLYVQSAINIRNQAQLLTKNLNYILSILTGIIAVISLIKVL